MAFSAGGRTDECGQQNPVYSAVRKILCQQRGIILHDAKAEEIWAAEGFRLKGKSASKWLSFYMGMRAAVFDRWVKECMEAMPEAAVCLSGRKWI